LKARLAVQLDAVGGIAGDMFVAALLDARPDLRARVLADASCVLPRAAGTPMLEEGISGGLRCLRFRLADVSASASHAPAHAPGGHGYGEQAHYKTMASRIGSASLAPGTAAQALAMLRLLAEAEAAIHGVPLDAVHFHEISDWDSLMDLVAAGSIVAALPDADWAVSALPRGGGHVRTQHGFLPVPAPATTHLLRGFPWYDDGIAGERVTPTGAAILRHLVRCPGINASGVMGPSGFGAGTRELPGQPNILRACLFTAGEPTPTDEVIVLSFDVDDMTGEELAHAASELRRMDGVLDLALIPALGKKGRPVQIVRLLVQPDHQETVAQACLVETSTLGLRWHKERRLVIPRTLTRDCRTGLRIKTALRATGPTHKVEHDDLRGIKGLDRRRATARAAEQPPEEEV
jgi:uncharacterized protein (TIGR00299 family) protein